jgi:hypothetical protein
MSKIRKLELYWDSPYKLERFTGIKILHERLARVSILLLFDYRFCFELRANLFGCQIVFGGQRFRTSRQFHALLYVTWQSHSKEAAVFHWKRKKVQFDWISDWTDTENQKVGEMNETSLLKSEQNDIIWKTRSPKTNIQQKFGFCCSYWITIPRWSENIHPETPFHVRVEIGER